ncbi:MAG: T9SS type A sorting domain-containing protein [Bacteroidales bacterium]|nr:T9SS type A sorting domain-containing protein [Bacteroidales bacterium]
MKRLNVLLFLVAFGMAAAYAQQQYRPVPFQLDNAIWYEYYVDAGAYITKRDKENHFHFAQFTLDTNDFYLNRIKYREIIFISNGIAEHTGIGFREDTANRRIYICRSSGNTFEETLLYDFSVIVGDTVKRLWDNNYIGRRNSVSVVSSIDTVSIGGVLRKKINFSYVDAEHLIITMDTLFICNEFWIEGIGSSLGLLFPSVLSNSMVMENLLVCYSHNDSVIYHEPHFSDCMPAVAIITPTSPSNITAYPNPAKDRITFDFGGAQFETLQVINTAGVVVRDARLGGQTQYSLPLKGLPTGVYIYRVYGTNITEGKFIK